VTCVKKFIVTKEKKKEGRERYVAKVYDKKETTAEKKEIRREDKKDGPENQTSKSRR
jgi:hypothetical protein